MGADIGAKNSCTKIPFKGKNCSGRVVPDYEIRKKFIVSANSFALIERYEGSELQSPTILLGGGS